MKRWLLGILSLVLVACGQEDPENYQASSMITASLGTNYVLISTDLLSWFARVEERAHSLLQMESMRADDCLILGEFAFVLRESDRLVKVSPAAGEEFMTEIAQLKRRYSGPLMRLTGGRYGDYCPVVVPWGGKTGERRWRRDQKNYLELLGQLALGAKAGLLHYQGERGASFTGNSQLDIRALSMAFLSLSEEGQKLAERTAGREHRSSSLFSKGHYLFRAGMKMGETEEMFAHYQLSQASGNAPAFVQGVLSGFERLRLQSRSSALELSLFSRMAFRLGGQLEGLARSL